MFLQHLSPDQRSAFLNLAYRLIAADGHLHSAELQALTAMAARAAVPSDWQLSRDSSDDELAATFPTYRSRAAVLMELLGLAYADTEYSEPERVFVREVATSLAISPDRLALMEGWVVRQLLLAEEGNQLLEAH